MPSVAIVGIGRLGGALALALSRKGYAVDHLIHRGSQTANKIAPLIAQANLSAITATSQIKSDIVVLTTPDPEIGSAAASIANRIRSDAIVMHTSGSLSSDVLSSLVNEAASLHPLVSISDAIIGADRFTGTYFCIEGDAVAVDAANKMAIALGGIPFSIDTKLKPLYHASAVMASGNFVALQDMAVEMLAECGLSAEEAKAVLMPLVRSTLENLGAQPNERALTGTFARADVDAFERHLASFAGKIPQDVREVYLLLAERSLDLAERTGISKERINELRDRIDIAKENFK